jgi:hypothetical protein
MNSGTLDTENLLEFLLIKGAKSKMRIPINNYFTF